jgi:1-acyl-sn-glycerol-3-phosphate acyltransferase
VIRLFCCVICWVLCAVPAAVIGFPALYITGKVDLLYRLSMWGARTGYRLAGLRVRVIGREQLVPGQAYLFMANHASNLDPPIIAPELGRRVSIIAKHQLFHIPIFGRAMRAGNFVEINRASRRSALESVRAATRVLQSGVGMMVFPEGTRSRDGRLLPFKKALFHLAIEAGVPVVPITIVGTHDAWPKGRLSLRRVPIEVHFHAPVDPHNFATRDELLVSVRAAINSALPDAYRE